jgi:hypothetical protein
VCLSENANCALFPCNHDLFCLGCISKLTINYERMRTPCLLCRKRIHAVDVRVKVNFRNNGPVDDLIRMTEVINKRLFVGRIEDMICDLMIEEAQNAGNEQEDPRASLERKEYILLFGKLISMVEFELRGK